MNFPFYIARRYLFSKKSTHAINIISLVSVLGVAVATTALVVILSGFNGFADVVASFFTNFDPQIKVEPAHGKTMKADAPELTKLKTLPEVDVVSFCLQDMALAVYGDQQAMVNVKGVDDNFADLSGIRNILYGNGDYTLHAADLQYGIPGIGLAQQLGLGAKWNNYLRIYAPRRKGQFDISNPENAFSEDSLLSPGVVFQVKQGKYDKNYIITSLDFARKLFHSGNEVSSVEIRLKAGYDVDKVKEEIKNIVGANYTVKDRFEQQADTFKIMKIEKLFAYIFLTFILFIACFNIIGSLSMLIIDKKADVATLRNLGANDKQIRRIFLFEGRMISVAGAVVGIAVGLLLCWLQQTYGIVRLGDEAGNFVINAYPISVHPFDIVMIFVTVIVVGWIAVWYPVRRFTVE